MVSEWAQVWRAQRCLGGQGALSGACHSSMGPSEKGMVLGLGSFASLQGREILKLRNCSILRFIWELCTCPRKS